MLASNEIRRTIVYIICIRTNTSKIKISKSLFFSESIFLGYFFLTTNRIYENYLGAHFFRSSLQNYWIEFASKLLDFGELSLKRWWNRNNGVSISSSARRRSSINAAHIGQSGLDITRNQKKIATIKEKLTEFSCNFRFLSLFLLCTFFIFSLISCLLFLFPHSQKALFFNAIGFRFFFVCFFNSTIFHWTYFLEQNKWMDMDSFFFPRKNPFFFFPFKFIFFTYIRFLDVVLCCVQLTERDITVCYISFWYVFCTALPVLLFIFFDCTFFLLVLVVVAVVVIVLFVFIKKKKNCNCQQ